MKNKLILFILMILSIINMTYGQQSKISGSVKDSSGEPLIGVSVLIKNSNNGVITDINGNYVLFNVPKNSTIVFSYVGMLTIEQKINNRSVINVTLKDDSKTLNEIVVIGYGTTTKRKLVGAVSSIDGKKLEGTTFSNVGQALQGQIPGLVIGNVGGAPGNLPSISIRGGETPLFIIDGVIADEYSFNILNPNDIASISFLKDASASAVYGSKAGDGIILVKTKRGEIGKVNIKYSGNYQLSQPTVLPELMNSYEFALMNNDASDMDGTKRLFTEEQLDIIKGHTDLTTYPDNNWEDICLKDFSSEQSHNLSISSGNEISNYFLSMGYLNQSGILKSNAINLDRFTIRANTSTSFKKIGLDVGLNLNADLQKKRDPSYISKIFRNIITTSPLVLGNNSDGTYATLDYLPNVQCDRESGYIKNKKLNIDAQLTLNWRVRMIKGLSLGLMSNYRDGYETNKSWTVLAPQYNLDGTVYKSLKPVLEQKNINSNKMDIDFNISYNRIFGKHGIDATFVYSQRQCYNEELAASRRDFVSDAVDQIFAGPIDGISNYGTSNEEANMGYVGRIKYDFDSKYIVEFSGRYDGNDNFAPSKRWGFFPAVSVVWILSDEPFLSSFKDNCNINNLKLRLSYGKTGISSGVNRFGYLQTYSLEEKAINIGNSLYNGYTEGNLVNPEALSWYNRASTNFGIDFALFNNKLEGSVDYFFYKTNGYLMNPKNKYSTTLGKDLPQIASNSSHRRAGLELALNYKQKINKLFFEIGGNISYYNQLWEQLDSEDLPTLMNPYIRETHETDYFRNLYLSNGLYQNTQTILNSPRLTSSSTSLHLGDIYYKDVNGDGQIDENDKRRTGNSSMPHLNYGINFKLKYNEFELRGLVQGTGKRNVSFGNINGSTPKDMTRKFQLDYWTENNTNSRFPRISHTYDTPNLVDSDFWMLNAQYLRLKSLILSYNLKAKLLKKINCISGCQLVFTGTNLITFSDVYDYFDPEDKMAEDKNYAGNYSGLNYPVQRTYSLGFNIQF